ncbi:MAG: hypothetical protein RMK91_07180 [Pseudanabaenaceae cyanobacterium SKYGB_i_bin29]|nr:hypothetical protein [Pseudanabaenaceae cyanobacterium SKYG29]MDW8421635.1 hypothetical protein [Pseudanabaenaceae cyanobacterium SKYGB_i_bin29]
MRQNPVNLRKRLTHLTLVTATTTLTSSLVFAPSAYASRDYCSLLNGQWHFEGQPGPIITEYGREFKVDMSVYGRPTATGKFVSPNQIQVTFPDDKTFIGTLDGMGNIRWNNGTVWQSLNFAGKWRYELVPGPIVMQEGRNLTVDMSAYRRPTARGTLITSSQARVTFPDDATFVGTLVSPSCIRWSNGTVWTKK